MNLKHYPYLSALLLVTWLGIPTNGRSQSEDSTAARSPKNTLVMLKPVTIQLDFPKEPSASRFASLFHHFEVIDARPDTTRIGLHSERVGINGFRVRQLRFGRPAKGEITAYLDARFSHPGEAYTALVVIRTLWLSDANNLKEELLKDEDKYREKSKIRLKAEIYAEKDGQYIPLYRFDSLQISFKNSNARFGKDLSGMLEDMADSATLVLAKKGGEARKIDFSSILQFNQSRFDCRISKDSSLVQGVYMNFEEFKNNTPSVTDCEVKKGKDHLILYLKEGGSHSYYSRTAWGYCDGNTVYIMKDGLLIPAWREGKTWYLFSQVETYDPKRQGGAPIGGPGFTGPGIGTGINSGPEWSPTTATNTNLMNNQNQGIPQRHIFTVDMDTGKLY